MAYTPKTWVNSNPITASDLNRIETGVDNVDTRVTTLESDTGVSAGVGTGQAGWTYQLQNIRKVGQHLACIDLEFTRIGSTISVTANGNVPNTAVVQLPAGYIPTIKQSLNSGASGCIASFIIDTSGMVYLCATAPGSDITSGTGLSVTGAFVV